MSFQISKRNWLPFLCTWFTILIRVSPSGAQHSNPQLIPAISFPTPEAASLGKFGTYKVSYFTGLPEISIPIYEVKVGELSLPISISYHPSGIKVTERASVVGLGWALEAGGSVSRRILGKNDDSFAGRGYLSGELKPPSQVTATTQMGLDYLLDVNEYKADTEPDIYTYSVPGHGGQFIFNGTNGNKPVLMPYSPMKIEYGSGTALAFALTDEKGTTYKLDSAYEVSRVNGGPGYITRWMLSKVIAPNKQDTIRIAYKPWTGVTYEDVTESILVRDSIDYVVGESPYYSTKDDMYPTPRPDVVESDEFNISSIKYPHGKVVFESLTNRKDAPNGLAKKKLDRILIYTTDPTTGSSSILKVVELRQSYFTSADGTNTKRLRLDGIFIRDGSNKIIQRYKFEYDTLHNLPEYKSKQRDYWGYFNARGNNTLIPHLSISFKANVQSTRVYETLGSTVLNGRDPDTVYMQANVLKKMYFPTGGSSEFTFETNRYLKNGVKTFAGGLRIAQIKSYDGISANPTLKSFKYGSNESGYGRANFFFSNLFFVSTYYKRYWYSSSPLYCPTVYGLCRERVYVSNPTVELEPFDSAPVVYSVVTEYNGDSNTNIGKTVYTYKDVSDILLAGPTYGRGPIETNHFRRGLLERMEVYKRIAPKTYQIINATINSYQAFPDTVISNAGLRSFKFRLNDNPLSTDLLLGPADSNDPCSYDYPYPDNFNDMHSFSYQYYDFKTGDNRLKSSMNIVYDQTTTLKSDTVSTVYLYENRFHQQVTKITTSNSLKQVRDITFKYPHEATGPVYTEMIQKHMYDYPVEQVTKLDGVDQKWNGWHYKKYYNYVFKPDTIYQRIESGPKESTAAMLGYDIRGNVLGVIGQDGIPVSYVYGYRNLYPIAKITGASSDQVGFTSFESGGNEGGWSFGGSSSGGKYGDKLHPLGTAVSKAGLATNVPYIVSYWAKGGIPTFSATVISTNDAPAAGADGWRYFEKTIQGSSTVNITGTSGILIDEVRLFPKGASMMTYTHRPHVGMTTTTDANGLTTFYSYDAFGRLAFIKDWQGRIVKSYLYNYKK